MVTVGKLSMDGLTGPLQALAPLSLSESGPCHSSFYPAQLVLAQSKQEWSGRAKQWHSSKRHADAWGPDLGACSLPGFVFLSDVLISLLRPFWAQNVYKTLFQTQTYSCFFKLVVVPIADQEPVNTL